MTSMWLCVWSNRPSIIYWHWPFLGHRNTNRFSTFFTFYPSQYSLPIMVADSIQNKWISNMENSSRSPPLLLHNVSSHEKFEFKLMSGASIWIQTFINSIYGTDTQCFTLISNNIEHLLELVVPKLFNSFSFNHSLFAFKLSTYDIPIDWFRFFKTFCSRSWQIFNSHSNIHIKFNISTFKSPKFLVHSQQNTYNLLKFNFIWHEFCLFYFYSAIFFLLGAIRHVRSNEINKKQNHKFSNIWWRMNTEHVIV